MKSYVVLRKALLSLFFILPIISFGADKPADDKHAGGNSSRLRQLMKDPFYSAFKIFSDAWENAPKKTVSITKDGEAKVVEITEKKRDAILEGGFEKGQWANGAFEKCENDSAAKGFVSLLSKCILTQVGGAYDQSATHLLLLNESPLAQCQKDIDWVVKKRGEKLKEKASREVEISKGFGQMLAAFEVDVKKAPATLAKDSIESDIHDAAVAATTGLDSDSCALGASASVATTNNKSGGGGAAAATDKKGEGDKKDEAPPAKLETLYTPKANGTPVAPAPGGQPGAPGGQTPIGYPPGYTGTPDPSGQQPGYGDLASLLPALLANQNRDLIVPDQSSRQGGTKTEAAAPPVTPPSIASNPPPPPPPQGGDQQPQMPPMMPGPQLPQYQQNPQVATNNNDSLERLLQEKKNDSRFNDLKDRIADIKAASDSKVATAQQNFGNLLGGLPGYGYGGQMPGAMPGINTVGQALGNMGSGAFYGAARGFSNAFSRARTTMGNAISRRSGPIGNALAARPFTGTGSSLNYLNSQGRQLGGGAVDGVRGSLSGPL